MAPGRKLISFEIEKKSVVYFDDNWKNGIQIYPLDKLMIKNLLSSIISNLKAMGLLIFDANKGENLRQYKSCKDEQDLSEMITNDCKLKGLLEIQ